MRRGWFILGATFFVVALLGAYFLTDIFRSDIPDALRGGPQLTLAPFASGFEDPVLVTHAGDERVFVVEQAGRVWTVAEERSLFLDIRDRVRSGGERGLLGVAFDPAFAKNGRVFVHYSDLQGDTVMSRFVAGPDRIDPSTERILLQVEQPYGNHNGGMIAFGPDGYLYMGLGDGGAAGDPHGNGQDPSTLLGSILRLDVSTDIAAPPDNPDIGGHPYVWAYGLRNPWRFSFDGTDLWVGDVGQGTVEEIDLIQRGGQNLGWNLLEGPQRYRPGRLPADLLAPVASYDHDGGHCSVTGGIRIRDPAVPRLDGVYVFADYCSGVLWTLVPEEDGWGHYEALDTDLRISSFGEDADGHAYVVDHAGSVYQIK